MLWKACSIIPPRNKYNTHQVQASESYGLETSTLTHKFIHNKLDILHMSTQMAEKEKRNKSSEVKWDEKNQTSK